MACFFTYSYYLFVKNVVFCRTGLGLQAHAYCIVSCKCTLKSSLFLVLTKHQVFNIGVQDSKNSVTRRPNQCSETPGLAPRSTESSVPSNHRPQNETLKLVLRCVSRGVSKHRSTRLSVWPSTLGCFTLPRGVTLKHQSELTKCFVLRCLAPSKLVAAEYPPVSVLTKHSVFTVQATIGLTNSNL